MKRSPAYKLIKVCVASLAVAACAAFHGSSLAASGIELQPAKVAPHVYYFRGEAGMASAENKGFMSNAGFIVTKDGVVIFDALATPALGEAMLRAIAKVTSQPVKRVIVSHYHADHFYGLQAFKNKGAEVWAHVKAQDSLKSDSALERLKQRRTALAPWVDEKTRLVAADRWLDFESGKAIQFEMGGIRFRIIEASGAHSPEDIMLFVEEDSVLFAGDLFFTGRIPFVGEANSRNWLVTLERMLEVKPAIVVPGHGPASDKTLQDMQLTRDYLIFLRKKMGEAVADMEPFDVAYQKVDWSQFEKYPAFQQANRLNAYGTYILMEKESLEKN
ncbi:MBL fold metallo-hydrolase [Noviherbaspirillum cavernae]|uniref:MBL fold metallo-hydrolase n=1 Tax=Noviherbaspirillum cavernae TaxID=2320862 RepID=A0A418WZQ5_9BURK|nr:MBL fold metallo-hydrolase [Noviherbaspirillum cavernae]RJG05686.1 MBL fold metallo-hydrolase [Noviherbaspirillum cavernae]